MPTSEVSTRLRRILSEQADLRDHPPSRRLRIEARRRRSVRANCASLPDLRSAIREARSLADEFSELRQLCQSEAYALEVPERRDRGAVFATEAKE